MLVHWSENQPVQCHEELQSLGDVGFGKLGDYIGFYDENIQNEGEGQANRSSPGHHLLQLILCKA